MIDQYLVLLGHKARISDHNKTLLVVRWLVKKEKQIQLVNTNGYIKDIIIYLNQIEYDKYNILFEEEDSIKKIMNLLVNNQNKINNIIMIGLSHHDVITPYLDHFIGTNIEIYIVSSELGIINDGTRIINEGALLLGSIYDLN